MRLPSTAGLDRKHPLYSTWHSMWLRCYYPGTNKFEYYGGRGITVDSRWTDFPTFCVDLGERPTGYQLDRIDTEGHYTRDNCRWLPANENRNRK